ncbi:MAG: aromatic acid exporter family protein, partial [Bacillus sp. (in: firmicutes)]
NPPTDSESIVCLNKKQLFDLFLLGQQEFTEPDHPHQYHTMQIIASIIDYGEQVEHLDTLIKSFHSYHHNEISIEEDTL